MRATSFRSVGLAFVTAVLVILAGGCSSNRANLLTLEACGKFVFPSSIRLVEYEEKNSFTDAGSLSVVDLPHKDLDEFKSRSGLDEFNPGVPQGWRDYWKNSAHVALLESDAGNEYSPGSATTMRWIVVHSASGGVDRIFLRVWC